MKRAILLVSFGTSYRDAREGSLENIRKDLEQSGKIPVYQAYTSGMIIRKLSSRGVFIDTVDEALTRILENHVRRLYVLPTHMIPGIEYRKMLEILSGYKKYFEEMKVAGPVLNEKEDCARLLPCLQSVLKFEPQCEYILMGHGTRDRSNIRYLQMNRAFEEAGLTNVHIASVEGEPDLAGALKYLQSAGKTGKVIVHPFMVVAGDHARNDMAGEENSYVTVLKNAGYPVEAIVKGLGEYPQFRRI